MFKTSAIHPPPNKLGGGLLAEDDNLQQYYAHNLRAMRAYTVWSLETDQERKDVMVSYSEEHWRKWTKGHQNAWLSWLWSSMSGETDDGEGLLAIKSLMLKPTRLWSSPLAGKGEVPEFFAVTFNTTPRWVIPPHLRKPTAYSTWQKEPWDVGNLPYDTQGLGDMTGVDYLVPYWLGRLHGFIK